MTNKPPMFGPSNVIDLTDYEPRSGKSALMNELTNDLLATGHCGVWVNVTQGDAVVAARRLADVYGPRGKKLQRAKAEPYYRQFDKHKF